MHCQIVQLLPFIGLDVLLLIFPAPTSPFQYFSTFYHSSSPKNGQHVLLLDHLHKTGQVQEWRKLERSSFVICGSMTRFRSRSRSRRRRRRSRRPSRGWTTWLLPSPKSHSPLLGSCRFQGTYTSTVFRPAAWGGALGAAEAGEAGELGGAEELGRAGGLGGAGEA